MARKISGAVLILAGIGVLAILIGNGMIFPHLAGPVILITAGIALIFRRKDRKRT